MINYIRSRLSEPERLAQLAEEAAELAQAALKLRRALDGTNPTPVGVEEAREGLHEEIADVLNVLDVLGVDVYDFTYDIKKARKLDRWARRLKEMEEQNHDV